MIEKKILIQEEKNARKYGYLSKLLGPALYYLCSNLLIFIKFVQVIKFGIIIQ